jgi:hypothetical protein
MKCEKEEVNEEEGLELLETTISDVKRGFDAWKEKVRGFAEKYRRLGIDIDYEDGRVEVSRCDPDIDEAKYALLVFLDKVGTHIEFDSNIFEEAVKVAGFALDKRQGFLDKLSDIAKELGELEIRADKEEGSPGDEAKHKSIFEAYMRRDRETGHLFIHIYRGDALFHDLEIALNLAWGVARITFNEAMLDDVAELMKKWVASDEEFLGELPRILKRYPLIWITVANKEMQ